MNTFIEGAPVPPPTESENEKVEIEPSLNSNQGFPPPPPPLQMPTVPNMSPMPQNIPFNGQPDFNNPDQMAAMNQWMMMNPYIFQMAAQMANQMAASGQVPPMPGMGNMPNMGSMPNMPMGNLPGVSPGMGSPQSSSNQSNPFNTMRRNSSSSSVGSVSIPVEHFDANGNKIERK